MTLEMSETSSVLTVSDVSSRLWATLTVCRAVDLWACLTIDRDSAPVILISVTSIVIVTNFIRSTTTELTTPVYMTCLVTGLAIAVLASPLNVVRTLPQTLLMEIFDPLALVPISSIRAVVLRLLPAKRSLLMNLIVLHRVDM